MFAALLALAAARPQAQPSDETTTTTEESYPMTTEKPFLQDMHAYDDIPYHHTKYYTNRSYDDYHHLIEEIVKMVDGVIEDTTVTTVDESRPTSTDAVKSTSTPWKWWNAHTHKALHKARAVQTVVPYAS